MVQYPADQARLWNGLLSNDHAPGAPAHDQICDTSKAPCDGTWRKKSVFRVKLHPNKRAQFLHNSDYRELSSL